MQACGLHSLCFCNQALQYGLLGLQGLAEPSPPVAHQQWLGPDKKCAKTGITGVKVDRQAGVGLITSRLGAARNTLSPWPKTITRVAPE